MKIFHAIALQLILILFFISETKAQYDHSDILSWTVRTAETIDQRLNDAAVAPDQANLLVKLMESYEDFEAVALVGLYCHAARRAAEEGRHHCNWLSGFTRDKDLNSLIERAQNARVEANEMRTAASVCLKENKLMQSQSEFTLASLLRSNAASIQHDLSDGLASEDFHILAQKTEHAERIFHDTELLALRLQRCDPALKAARAGIQACRASLAAPNWTRVKEHLLVAIESAAIIDLYAEGCR